MFITILATVTCVSVALLPAAAEVQRVLGERDNPIRLLDIKTRRSQASRPSSGPSTREDHS